MSDYTLEQDLPVLQDQGGRWSAIAWDHFTFSDPATMDKPARDLAQALDSAQRDFDQLSRETTVKPEILRDRALDTIKAATKKYNEAARAEIAESIKAVEEMQNQLAARERANASARLVEMESARARYSGMGNNDLTVESEMFLRGEKPITRYAADLLSSRLRAAGLDNLYERVRAKIKELDGFQDLMMTPEGREAVHRAARASHVRRDHVMFRGYDGSFVQAPIAQLFDSQGNHQKRAEIRKRQAELKSKSR